MTLFSHVNPAHERPIAAICREEIDKAGADILVHASHAVRPVIREQSRLNSVLIGAYATSRGRKQLRGIEAASRKHGFATARRRCSPSAASPRSSIPACTRR